MSIQDEIIGFVAEVLEQDARSLKLSDHFVQDLAASSIDIMTLVMRIEQHYGLAETPDEQLMQIATIGDLIALIKSIAAGDEIDLGGEGELIGGLAQRSFAEDDFVDIAIASDHAGVELLRKLVIWLRHNGYDVLDLGPEVEHSVDYPDYARQVTDAIKQERAQSGILICGSGLGMSIAANRVEGIRAALVSEPVSARLARQHNDANILCLGSRMIGEQMAQACIDVFLTTPFEPGNDDRHRRRIRRIETLK